MHACCCWSWRLRACKGQEECKCVYVNAQETTGIIAPLCERVPAARPAEPQAGTEYALQHGQDARALK
jgi:hypothetical protein